MCPYQSIQGRKVIPFKCTFCPIKEYDIKGQNGRIIKTLYFGNLIIDNDNILIKTIFKRAISIVDDDNEPTGQSIVTDIYFDNTDNTLALYVDNQMTILDYEEIKKEIDKEKRKKVRV